MIEQIEARSAAVKKIRAKDVEWETFEGEAQGFVDISGESFEINISARVPRDTKWGESGTNVRAWTVGVYGESWFTEGEAEGLHASKTAAVAALNAHRDR